MNWISIGAFLAALSVLGGAFGAHGLKARLDPASLALWETAARYLMYCGLGLIAVGLTAVQTGKSSFDLSGYLLLVGGLIFSGTVAALALGGPRWLGAITPIGGLLLVAGLLYLAWAAMRTLA